MKYKIMKYKIICSDITHNFSQSFTATTVYFESFFFIKKTAFHLKQYFCKEASMSFTYISLVS